MATITLAQAEFILGDLGPAKRHLIRLLQDPETWDNPGTYREIQESIQRTEVSLLKHVLEVEDE
jgi:hypothetical protein